MKKILWIPIISFLLCPGYLSAQIDKAETKQNSGLRKLEDIVIYQDSAFYSAFPSVIKLSKKEYLLAFRRAPNRKIFGEKGNNHVDPNSYLVMMRSRDGKNWNDAPELLHAHPFGGSQDPCLIKLDNNDLLCTSYGWAFLRESGLENLKEPHLTHGDGATFLGGYYLRSPDQGSTWAGPFYPPAADQEVRFNAMGKLVPAYNRGALLQAKNGKLYWVVSVVTDQENPRHTSTHLLTSDDLGVNWQYAVPVASDPEIAFNETSLYETPKGDLVAFMRTSNYEGQACMARSTDGGKTFQPWINMGFEGYPLHALRLPDQRVLLTYGYRSEPFGIRARILNPECNDFATSIEFVIRDDGGTHDLGYPWAVQLKGNKVLVVYYFNDYNGTRYIGGSILEVE